MPVTWTSNPKYSLARLEQNASQGDSDHAHAPQTSSQQAHDPPSGTTGSQEKSHQTTTNVNDYFIDDKMKGHVAMILQ